MVDRQFFFSILFWGLIGTATLPLGLAAQAPHSAAREWNDELLEAIRNDFARPPVHGRNLFHTSIAMWDAWAAYDSVALSYLLREKATAADMAAARHEAISYAAYRILSTRFVNSPGAVDTLASFDAKMAEFGYDIGLTDTTGSSPAALGNRIAAAVLAFGATDGANEENDYEDRFYEPRNPPLLPVLPGNPEIVDPNLWQPLVLSFFVDQAGNPLPFGVPAFQSPEWGLVTPFALSTDDLTIYERDGNEYWVYLDPGPPPLIGGVGDADYRSGFEQVLEWSGLLDPSDGVMIDISPNARGDNTLGTNDGNGHPFNPVTGLPYTPQIVPAADYFRVLAEFWADGPDSETPPGHWFTIANFASDNPLVVKRIGGAGPVVDDLEWDVKLYLALSGAVHDAAVAAWGVKGWYDYVRPISAIRYMADNGQSSDPAGPSYHPNGISLEPGRVEVVTEETIAPGERHEHLAGVINANVGKIAAKAWRGPPFIPDAATTTADVGWILVENWWPYQRPTFVTPPFGGYTSGHSTFSRAAAEVLTLITGDAFFPGGFGEFFAPQNEFLVFEDGPSVDITLQWATYRDAADETSISRIYGGIHPTADDIPGRLMGEKIGVDAFELATRYFDPGLLLDGSAVFVNDGTSFQGNTYNGFELTGQEATLSSFPGEITRVAFLDPDRDLVFVEFGSDDPNTSLNISLRGFVGGVPSPYNQPGKTYSQGLAAISIENSTSGTYLSVFSLGNDPDRVDTAIIGANTFAGTVDGIADVQSISVVSFEGLTTMIAGINAANANFVGQPGLIQYIGISAPEVIVTDFLFIGDLTPIAQASPRIVISPLSTFPEISIIGGDLREAGGSRQIYTNGLVYPFSFTAAEGQRSISNSPLRADLVDGRLDPVTDTFVSDVDSYFLTDGQSSR